MLLDVRRARKVAESIVTEGDEGTLSPWRRIARGRQELLVMFAVLGLVAGWSFLHDGGGVGGGRISDAGTLLFLVLTGCLGYGLGHGVAAISTTLAGCGLFVAVTHRIYYSAWPHHLVSVWCDAFEFLGLHFVGAELICSAILVVGAWKTGATVFGS